MRSSYQEGRVEIQLSRGEGWYPVIKRGGLRSSYQEGGERSSYQVRRLEIQLSRGKGWGLVIKTGCLRSSYQEGRVEIQLSRGEGWDPVILFNTAKCLCPKPEPGFPTSNVVVFFVFSEWRREVVVRLVDIGGFVEYHCENLIFIMATNADIFLFSVVI